MTEIFQIVGMTFFFFLAFVLMLKRKYILYAVTFICCGLILLEKYLWQTELIKSIPAFAEAFVPLSFTIPVCLYLGSTHLLKSKFKWALFIIPILPYLNFLPFYTASIEYKNCYILYEMLGFLPENCRELAQFAPTFISESILDLLLIFEFGLLLLLWRIEKRKSSTSKASKSTLGLKKWNDIVFGLVCFAFVGTITGILFVPDAISLNSYFIPVIGFLTSLLIIDNSTFLNEVVKSSVYKKLSEKEVTELYQKIESALREERYYTDKELTLVNLAREMNVSANKVSYVLNSCQTSFKKLINTIRIQKATEFMITKEIENYSIEGISQMFGYKSKSTFYQNFKIQHSKTPKEFIKEHLNGSKT